VVGDIANGAGGAKPATAVHAEPLFVSPYLSTIQRDLPRGFTGDGSRRDFSRCKHLRSR
jgi:hypothetical protein